MGKRIKILAVVLMILGCIGSLICFFIGVSQLSQKTYNYYYDDTAATTGRMLMSYGGIGIFASFLYPLPLYWFGCLFEHVEITREIAEENKRKIDNILRMLVNDSSKDRFERTPNIRSRRTSESTQNNNPTQKDVTKGTVEELMRMFEEGKISEDEYYSKLEQL